MTKKGTFAALALSCMLALGITVGCSNGGGSNSSSSGGEKGVAATVNGQAIQENEVTDRIESMRKAAGYTDENAWRTYMASSSLTPEKVREQYINQIVDDILVKQNRSEVGGEATDKEVEEYIDNMKKGLDASMNWDEELAKAGFTEETLRKSVKETINQQKVQNHFANNNQASTNDLDAVVKQYATRYAGAKNSIYMNFSSYDEASAMKSRIDSGEVSFEEGNNDAGVIINSPGWSVDIASNFDQAYLQALNNLNKGQVSDPVQGASVFYLIKCTDAFNGNANSQLSDFPPSLAEMVRNNANSNASGNSYLNWINGLRSKAEIKINPMPSGLPYDVSIDNGSSSASSS